MRPEVRWLVMTALIVAVLLGISALALDRPDVVWTVDGPVCPSCRSVVNLHAQRCRECGTDFDWTAASDEQSPRAHHSLSRLEAQLVREHVRRLGDALALTTVKEKLGLSAKAASAYLEAIGRGRCGYCGGTGEEVASDSEPHDCPVCFGGKNCIASGGDGISTLGARGAHTDLHRLLREMATLSKHLTPAVRTRELERLARAFLDDHVGTVEAGQLPFWKDLIPGDQAVGSARPAAEVARARLDLLLEALQAAERP